MYIKTDGIVLGSIEYKDNDRLLTVLTSELGKITVRARGVKSSRSRLKAACQLMAFSELTLLEQQGRFLLTEANTKELFSNLQTDLERFSLASYFLQVTQCVAPEEDPMPELLSLLLNALYALAKLGKPQTMVKTVFELRLCCIAGFLPDLRGCMVCGNRNADRFNVTQGALQCATCRNENTDGIRLPVSIGTREAMRYICAAEPKKLFSFTLSEQSMRELSGITESYLCMRLERGFSTLDFYKSLFFEAIP